MPATPAGLVRRFALLSALRWFPIGLTIPVNVLLMQARGLDLAVIGGLYAIYGIVTIALELPTGGLADVVGRRTVLVAASIATTVSMLVAAVAQDVPWFALAMVLGATGRALGSGPLDAWYVDATHALDPEASVRVAWRAARRRGARARARGGHRRAPAGDRLAIWPSLASGPIIGLSCRCCCRGHDGGERRRDRPGGPRGGDPPGSASARSPAASRAPSARACASGSAIPCCAG